MENTPRCICTIETFFLDLLFGGFCITRRVFTCMGKGGEGRGVRREQEPFLGEREGTFFLLKREQEISRLRKGFFRIVLLKKEHVHNFSAFKPCVF